MKSFISFLTSRTFWLNVLLAVILSGILFVVALWLTNIYTNHGEKIIVPELAGKTLDEAEELLSSKKLKLQVIDSVFNRKVKAGSVVEQFPHSGKEVKRKRVIALTIATIAPQKVQIDAVKDLSLRQAIGQLSKKGITVEKLEYIESEFTNLVLGMRSEEGVELKAGDEVYKGEKFTLLVGKKENDVFSVPDLSRISENYAKRKALEAGFNIGQISLKDTYENRRNLQVSWQSLQVGTSATPGSVIDIILEKENENSNN